MKFKYLLILSLFGFDSIGGPIAWDRVEFFRPQLIRSTSPSQKALTLLSNGETEVRIKWKSERPVMVRVATEGEDALLRESGKVVGMLKPGLWTITPLLEDGDVELTITCVKNCFRLEITPQEAWSNMKNDEMLPIVRLAHQKLKDLSEDRETQKKLASGLVASFRNTGKVTRFPVLPPLHTLKGASALLGGFEASKPIPERIESGDLNKLLEEAMNVPYAEPVVMAKDLPRNKYGHFTDLAIPEIVLKQSPVIARVFTSLAAGNGTVINWRQRSLRSVQDFYDALLETGHTIEWQSERTFANFIALVRDESYVRWPAWFDTGIPMKDGHSLQVPMGHSQQSWLIRGPTVNARIAFFLGMSGVGFFPNIDERPAWTGMSARHLTVSGTEHDDYLIRTSFAYSMNYLRRVYKDLDGIAKGRPASGYGFLGVCNDSNAFVELAILGIKSTYPWVRNPLLLVADPIAQSDRLFAALPSDATLNAEDLLPGKEKRKETLCRIQGMNPYTLDNFRLPDDQLKADMKEVAEELGNGCR